MLLQSQLPHGGLVADLLPGAGCSPVQHSLHNSHSCTVLDSIADHYTPKKGNLQLCQNYRTISRISQSSKVMLKVILNRLKPTAEEIIAEEQAGFRAGRSTTEQIFNLRILCEKYLQHQQNLYHIFIEFKKAFDRVWHATLWATMRK